VVHFLVSDQPEGLVLFLIFSRLPAGWRQKGEFPLRIYG